MNPFHLTVLSAMRHPRRTLWSAGLVTFVLLFAFPFVQVDVDPESMLAQDEPVRVEHHQIKARMELYDMLVLAVTYDEHADGVFNPGSLARLQRLSAYIATLDGVVAHELLTPDNIDAIEPGRPGSVRFERVMPQPPLERAGALKVRQRLIDNPFLWKTMVSTDRKALAIYIPISAKEHSWRIASQTKQKIAQINGPEAYHLAGLPVAEDTFGVEMFIQMAISAPLAMLFIATLIWFFVRNLWLTGATLLLAMLSVLITMGAFIASGQTLHIMSSMIPIFIMPIAVLDAVHILSQFFDGYTGDRRESLRRVMQDLWQPMLFTSLTTSAGFLSLVWAPIPPIQAFGLFTGLGILVAWLLSMTFLPAFICLLPDTALSHFGARARAVRRDWLGRLLNGMRRTAISRPTWTLGLTLAFAAIAIFGLNRLQINDNPVKWFAPQHEIRVADRLINERFGGSYLVYLSLEQPFTTEDQEALRQRLNPLLLAIGEEGKSLHDWISQQAATFSSPVALLDGARQWLQGQIVGVPAIAGGQPSMSDAPAFEMESTPVDSGRRQRLLQLDELLASSALPYQIMKRPEVLAWMDRMAEEAHIGAVHRKRSIKSYMKAGRKISAFRIPPLK
jgi:predicted RND superfamily exporter protein